MTTTTYRFPARQRWACLLWGLVVAALPTTIAVVTLARGRGGDGITAAWLGVVALLIGLFYLSLAFGRTVVSESGIGSWRPLRRQAWTWDEIASVRVQNTSGGRGLPVDRVVLRTVRGREHSLAVPYSTPGISDAGFDRTADEMIAAWRARSPHAALPVTKSGPPSRAAARAVVAFFVLCGLAAWTACAVIEVRAWNLHAHGVRTTATVQLVEERKNDDDAWVSFTDRGGVVQAEDVGLPHGTSTGETVTVVYAPGNPGDIRSLASLERSLWAAPLVLIPFGAAFVGLGVFARRKSRT
ncbi:DUF3592 domain-containing protein [Streptacidiphilus jiangxiensis]|uniref:Uncharacterized protein n=1 Tax=Streptacidiphilus jiangxiensis TaxID=235985 RepID=A0A1H7Z7I4_STRJI|nr:DUF3592 domain-containing protein [Streptacidiphilus jiangxiensis]SEM54191.1 hypothetical protein SAMN05414137_13325 [Streptacidiphilus jiangxiensis]